MKRRKFTQLLAGATLLPQGAHAQRNSEAPKVGYVYTGTTEIATQVIDVIVEGLRASGFAPPQVELVTRATQGDPGKLSAMVKEVIGRNVSVFVAAGPALLRAATAATDTLPIVAYDFETDPVAEKFAQSIARPGGNVTGVFLDIPTFSGKWIELLRECLPGLSRIAVVWDSSVGRRQVDTLSRIAGDLKIATELLEVRVRPDLAGAFEAARSRGADAAILLSSPLIFQSSKEIADLSLSHRVPAISLFSSFARSGGLISYGPSLFGAARQAGFMAGKVLGGSMAASLPIERPAKFELIVNQRAAEALGIALPPSIAARADEVIE
jgi:putative ABC transport system substrate-binding protein